MKKWLRIQNSIFDLEDILAIHLAENINCKGIRIDFKSANVHEFITFDNDQQCEAFFEQIIKEINA